MRRSALESIFYKDRNPENQKAYKKQKNYCSRLYKKERKKYYANLNIDKITDNIKFWKTVKPFISEKRHNTQNILLVERENIISTDKEVADTMNNFFSCAAKSLDIPSNSYLTNFTNLDDPIDQIK